MLGLALAAFALGASNAAAAVGMGMGGVDTRDRVRITLTFGAFEVAMPLVGLALGRAAATALGGAAEPVGGALLVLIGIWDLLGAPRAERPAGAAGVRLALLGLALSIDNLIVGFALGSLSVSFAAAAVTIGVVSMAMTLLGLEIGNRLGPRFGARANAVGGAVLILVGVALAAGLL